MEENNSTDAQDLLNNLDVEDTAMKHSDTPQWTVTHGDKELSFHDPGLKNKKLKVFAPWKGTSVYKPKPDDRPVQEVAKVHAAWMWAEQDMVDVTIDEIKEEL